MQTENQVDVAVAAPVDEEQMLGLPVTTQSGSRTALDLAGRALWRVPGCFDIARLLGPSFSLRCVIFHDISDAESSLTKGMGVTVTRANFESALRFLAKHYTPVSLQEVLEQSDGRRLPPRPVLVTFDDAYASVVEFAAPLCRKFGVPAVFFVNAAFLNNQRLALDNLVCYVANALGLGAVNAAVRAADGTKRIEVQSLTEVFSLFLPTISLQARRSFRDALVQLARISELDLAGEAALYLTSQHLHDLNSFNFEIGNHTFTHVNCRSLSRSDFDEEVGRNKEVLEDISGRPVRSFSVPYGSSADLSAELVEHLQGTGHEAIFLAESVANQKGGDLFQLNRVSVKGRSDAELFSEIEILPRLRMLRNRLSDVVNSQIPRKVSYLERIN
jgi:peptidoglycan/xylan/chitin deacetylase (PgdA/CDA1 family)